jgi:hypothetical protein
MASHNPPHILQAWSFMEERVRKDKEEEERKKARGIRN